MIMEKRGIPQQFVPSADGISRFWLLHMTADYQA
jgi:hypothetical protein